MRGRHIKKNDFGSLPPVLSIKVAGFHRHSQNVTASLDAATVRKRTPVSLRARPYEMKGGFFSRTLDEQQTMICVRGYIRQWNIVSHAMSDDPVTTDHGNSLAMIPYGGILFDNFCWRFRLFDLYSPRTREIFNQVLYVG